MSRRGALLFTAMAVIWGIPYLLIRVAVEQMSPSVVVLARTALGALVLLPFAMRRGALAAALRHWPWLVLYAVVEVAVPWLLLTDAETRLSSSLAGLLVATVPLIGVVITLVTGHDDRLDRRALLGLVVGFAGVMALLGLDFGSGEITPGPVIEVLITAVCYATGPVIVARRLSDVPAMGVNAAALGLTALGYLPFGLTHLPARLPDARALAALAVLAIVCTALAFVVFFALIAEVGPSRATIITYVNPAVAIALGVALLGEPLTAGMLVGFPLVLLGSVVGARRRRVPATDTTSPTGATGATGPAAATEMPPPPALPVEEPIAAPTLEAEVIATAGRSAQGCVPR